MGTLLEKAERLRSELARFRAKQVAQEVDDSFERVAGMTPSGFVNPHDFERSPAPRHRDIFR